MKKIYSLQVFFNEVKKIAALVKEDYVKVRAEIENTGEVTFHCYIHKYGWHESRTMEGSLERIRNEITKNPAGSIDVEIEMDEPAKEFNV